MYELYQLAVIEDTPLVIELYQLAVIEDKPLVIEYSIFNSDQIVHFYFFIFLNTTGKFAVVEFSIIGGTLRTMPK